MNTFRKKTDHNKYNLKNELDKFNGKISERVEGSFSGGFSFCSMITPYGLEKIKMSLLERILYKDRPVTLLWHHKGGHSIGHNWTPVKQRDGQEPVNGQKGGYYRTPYCRDDSKDSRMEDYYEWVTFGRKKSYINGKPTAVKLDHGEPLANIEPKYDWAGSSGYWQALPHYMPESENHNCFPGDVKKAILASPLSNECKQELLDELYLSKCPVKAIDRKYSKTVKNFCHDIKRQIHSLEYIENKKSLIVLGLKEDNAAEFIIENLILNIDNAISDFYT